MSGDTGRTDDVRLERLHWTFEVGGRAHVLDILPAAVIRSVALELDGQPVRHVPKPTSQHPWRETTIEADGTSAVVALIWHRPVMRTDLFVEGRSMVDGRSLEAARATAPRALTAYEAWVGDFYGGERPPSRPLLPRPMAALLLVALLAVLAPFVVTSRPSGIPAAVVVLVASVSIFILWLRSWMVVLERAHTYLLRRADLGDGRRFLGFFAVLVGYPIATFVPILVIAILARG